MVTYRSDIDGVDWARLREDLIGDDFHNGRTTDQLRLSFANSAHVALAFDGNRCVGNARALSDGVGNAYVVDVWTHGDYRDQGIATRLMQMLIEAVPGQHVYLQTDTAVALFARLGFHKQPHGMSIVVGDYLQNDTRTKKPPS